jgi:Protein of unknown function (DUF3168)
MGTPSNALQAAIFTTLSNNTALTALIGSGQVFDFVSESAKPPFVRIGDDTAIDWGTKSTHGWETTVTIHCWDFEVSGRKSVKAILSAIYDALHEQTIAVAGFNLIQCRYEFEQTFQDTTEVGQNDQFYHGVQRYRITIQS